MKLENILLPHRSVDTSFDITIENSTVETITPAQPKPSNGKHPPSLLIPSLCHPHIHLDKSYLLSSTSTTNTVDYSDLVAKDGTFQEALQHTSQAKTRYTSSDLLHRGYILIAESIRAGVTSMRAFVEIDHVTHFMTLQAVIGLKRKFERLCHIQICAFAQDPIFSTDHGETNRQLLSEALTKFTEIEVLGTTPYVETFLEASRANITWAVQTALQHNLHLDFHLDYNLDSTKPALIWTVLSTLRDHHWPQTTTTTPNPRTVVLGHCTRLTLFTSSDLTQLSHEIGSSHLPIYFIGLPTSDLFMMGRPPPSDLPSSLPMSRPRGTLDLPTLIHNHHLNCALGVNNVGNVFTPWGSPDPLRLASLAVGVYQDGTPAGAQTILECVTSRARRAIGLDDDDGNLPTGLDLKVGAKGPWLLIRNSAEQVLEIPKDLDTKGNSVSRDEEKKEQLVLPTRQWRTVTDVVWDPPGWEVREVIR